MEGKIALMALGLPVLFFSVILHECAHGWVASLCGDDTARLSGRLTLNPLPHIDPIGTVFLPLLFILTGSPVLFGWAKPVPINPLRFNNFRQDLIKVTLAGPGTNLLLAIFSALALRGMRFLPHDLPFLSQFATLFYLSVLINVALAVFNLIPIPPLDGSRVMSAMLPTEAAIRYEALTPYGFIILIALLWTRILDRLISPVMGFLHTFLLG